MKAAIGSTVVDDLHTYPVQNVITAAIGSIGPMVDYLYRDVSDALSICTRWLLPYEGRVGGGYSLVACLSNLTIDLSSFSRRRNVPTPNGDTSNIRPFFHVDYHVEASRYYHISFLFGLQ